MIALVSEFSGIPNEAPRSWIIGPVQEQSNIELTFGQLAIRWVRTEEEEGVATSELILRLYFAIAATFLHLLASRINDAVHDGDGTLLSLRPAAANLRPEKYFTRWRRFRRFLHQHYDSYSRVDEYLSRKMTNPSANLTEKARDLRSRYTSVLEAGNRHEQMMRDAIQVDVATLSLEESRRAIQQSKEISMLTRLAFIFIPLTFTTGVFGMNIKPFEGGAPMQRFWITISSISAGVAVLYFGLLFHLWARVKSIPRVEMYLQERDIKKKITITKRSMKEQLRHEESG